MKRKVKYLIGIDEAGRGPLAGPVAVGAVISKNRYLKILNGIKDSKKITARKREEWDKIIRFNFIAVVSFTPPSLIDKIGIVKAVDLAMKKAIKNILKKSDCKISECHFLLDGSLKAPKGCSQETIIRGDEKIPLISAAGITAKVARDKKMVNLDKKLPKYGFKKHKGYGTKLHYKMLKKFGISPEHRKSFCRKLKLSTESV